MLVSQPPRGADIPRTVFPFFDLPRELRNMIYREVTCDTPSRSFTNKLQVVSVKDYPMPSMQLISRRFKEEYLQEVFRFTLVHIRMFEWGMEAKALTSALQWLPQIISVRAQHGTLRGENCQGWQYGDFSMDMTPVYEQAVNLLPTLLPALSSLTVECVGASLHSYRINLQRSHQIHTNFLSLTHDRVAINPALIMEDYFMLPSHRLPVDVKSAMMYSSKNRVFYRVAMSDGPYSLYGLRLEVESGGTFGLEDLETLLLKTTDAKSDSDSE